MPTSVTGTWSNVDSLRLARTSAGFTLVEILVVVVIIGLISAGALIAFTGEKRDRQLERETDRVYALLDYVREQSELQTREYGLRVDAAGYEFVTFDVRGQAWRAVDEDDALGRRELPAGLVPTLVVDGRKVVLDEPKEEKDLQEFAPQVIVFGSGDMSSFEFQLQRDGEGPEGKVWSDENGALQTDHPGKPAT
ncbi:MAG: type II secretion system minor pseudopilin GspH [Proteobacteria bacterium]|nr:type II secretion system minor pseudopilin GspH [Pseudomonadota bacterium]